MLEECSLLHPAWFQLLSCFLPCYLLTKPNTKKKIVVPLLLWFQFLALFVVHVFLQSNRTSTRNYVRMCKQLLIGVLLQVIEPLIKRSH